MAKKNRKVNQVPTNQVVLSKKQYDSLRSRPKQSTLKKDTSSVSSLKGVRGNPYLHTLLNPFQVTGVKVPSVVSFPTSTIAVYQRMSDTFLAGKSFWANAYMPCAVKWRTSFHYGTGSWDNNWTSMPNYAAFNDMYHSYRPVSAGYRVTYAGDLATNRGMLAIALLPRGQTLNTLTSFTAVANLPGAFVGRVSEGVEFIWKPQDVADTEFKLTSTGVTSQMATDIFPGIVCALDGLADQTVVQYEYFVNFEAIPENRVMDLVSTSVNSLPSSMMQDATGVLASIQTLAQPIGDSLGQVFRRLVADHGADIVAKIGNAAYAGAIHYAYSNVRNSRLIAGNQRLITL